ncbi:hypothetical protein [Propionivibrio sp.]|uniref:hypothetical protein n=1 Tax=Betaproteobacteria TaxID=28216 RepID=UPI00261345E2|nr:hypothetical protein [Propionivibrio sp.]MBK8358680.1 hypothetical protein [Comamonadaceae bacterium]MBK9028340.1 hypothetical protein [Propionivibrio sp.]
MSEISTNLYWSLPGPAEFVGKITDASRNARAIILSLTEYPPNGLWDRVRKGLSDANIFEPVELTITEGMDVGAEIGTHFSVPSMPAGSLAHHRHGHQHTVILKATGRHSQEHCEQYAKAFVEAIEHASGDVRLIVAIHDGQNQKDLELDGIHLIAFDGTLNAAEMDAYVTQRMVSSQGPGTTRLTKQLVTEYAGFDPEMAEILIAMEPSRIMGLPESLTPLLATNMLRWSVDSWVGGTQSTAMPDAHSLREWYVATHPGENADKFRRASDRRYWRACLRAIIPWVEERRPAILEALSGPLYRLEQSHGGTGELPKKMGDKIVQVTRDDLEFNDLFYFFKAGFGILTGDEEAAVTVCRRVKRVRDELAHVRRPQPDDIISLITEMDAIVK